MDYGGFVGGSYQSQAVTADQERTVNLYVEKMESPGATARSALYPTPGVSQIVAGTYGAGRAHFFQGSREFAVSGTTFYEISQTGIITSRGTVAQDTNPATISSNGDGGGELFITSGSNGYIFDLTTATFTQITALNGKCTMGDHLDGFFLALNAETSTLYASNLLDGLTWNTGTMFAQRSKAPDPWRSFKVNGSYIWLFGQHTSEAWFNNGASPFPFAPYPPGFIQYGIAAPFSPAIAEGTLYWLGAAKHGEAFVIRLSGFTPEIVSDYPTQYAMGSYPTLSDATGDTYTEAGHGFYVLTFPTQNVTWAYDAQTGLWAERGTWISESSEYIAWRPRYHVLAFGEHRILDSATGSVYRMATSLPNDVGSRPIRRLRRAPALTFENRRIFYSSFELDFEPGLGISTGQGSDPQIMMRMSNDGGKTWGQERMRSAGATGQYGRRAIWNRLGAARRRVFEVSFSEPIPWRITGAILQLGQELPKVAA